MAYVPGLDDKYRELARARLQRGDLFAYPYAVVTVMTGGRYYGKTSKEAVARRLVIPELAHGCAQFVRTAPDRGFVCVTLWNDQNVYSPKLIYECTRACLNQALVHRLPQLALPLLGGNERASFLGAMEQAVDHAEDEAGEQGAEMPEVVFVTDLEFV